MTTYFLGFFVPVTKFDKIIPSFYELVPVNQRHLTLMYFGYVHNIDNITKVLSLIKLECFTIKFRGIKPFPSDTKPRYLAAIAVPESENYLRRIREEVSRMYRLYADRYEEFKPHVSIAVTRRKPDLHLHRVVKKTVRQSQRILDEVFIDRMCLIKADGGSIASVHCIKLS